MAALANRLQQNHFGRSHQNTHCHLHPPQNSCVLIHLKLSVLSFTNSDLYTQFTSSESPFAKDLDRHLLEPYILREIFKESDSEEFQNVANLLHRLVCAYFASLPGVQIVLNFTFPTRILSFHLHLVEEDSSSISAIEEFHKTNGIFFIQNSPLKLDLSQFNKSDSKQKNPDEKF